MTAPGPANVHTVLVDGRIVKRHGTLVDLNLAQLRRSTADLATTRRSSDNQRRDWPTHAVPRTPTNRSPSVTRSFNTEALEGDIRSRQWSDLLAYVYRRWSVGQTEWRSNTR